MLARRAYVQATYQGVDITDNLAEDVISISYTDALDEADKLDITVKDEYKKWLLKWKPQRTDTLTAQIMTFNWADDGDSGFIDCGIFIVDQVKYAGRPTTATIGAVSMPADQNFAGAPKNRTWEQVTLSELASSLLPAGYTLDFRSDDDPLIEYVEQKDTDDCAFLFDQAKKYGFRIKLIKNRVMLASAQWLEAQGVSFVITEDKLFSWSLDAELSRTLYDGCTVKYQHPKTEEEIEHTFMAPGAQGSKLYESTQAVSSVADAERVAKAELREQNQGETTLSFTLMGNTGIFAGQVCSLSGFGDFDGRYHIDQAVHKVGNGYTTDISLHRCLEGY